VIVAVAAADTVVVRTVNRTDVAPAGTTIVAGTLATALSEVRITVTPPAGAAPVSLTVPVEV
jgi:hypothetical protein